MDEYFFLLSEEQAAARDMTRRFAEETIGPRAAEIDQSGEFPRDIYNAMADLGLFGLLLPVEAGGAGSDLVTYSVVTEELARVSGTAANLLAASEPVLMLHEHAKPGLRDKWVPGILNGTIVPAFALTEPTAGSDARAIRTTAMRDGDYYVVNGTKQFTTFGSVADFVIVIAITEKKEQPSFSALLVETPSPGVHVGAAEDLVGVRGTATSGLHFENCQVPIGNLIGSEGEGLRLGLSQINKGRVGTAAMAVGLAQAAYEAALDYTHEREQFGRPIFEFQAVQFKLASMATRIDAARLLYLTAARLHDNGHRANRLSSEAKLFASQTAGWVTDEALQLFGGYGYVRSNKMERLWRDAKICQIYEGTTNIQNLIISREISKSRRKK